MFLVNPQTGRQKFLMEIILLQLLPGMLMSNMNIVYLLTTDHIWKI